MKWKIIIAVTLNYLKLVLSINVEEKDYILPLSRSMLSKNTEIQDFLFQNMPLSTNQNRLNFNSQIVAIFPILHATSVILFYALKNDNYLVQYISMKCFNTVNTCT